MSTFTGTAQDDTITPTTVSLGVLSTGQSKPSAANDTVHGGGGNDFMDGGAGNDSLVGGSGDDVIYGGDAGVIFVPWYYETISGFGEFGYSDESIVDPGVMTPDAPLFDDHLFGVPRKTDLLGDHAFNTSAPSEPSPFRVDDGVGFSGGDVGSFSMIDDFPYSFGDGDIIEGGFYIFVPGGNDIIEGGAGADDIDGGDGDDIIYGDDASAGPNGDDNIPPIVTLAGVAPMITPTLMTATKSAFMATLPDGDLKLGPFPTGGNDTLWGGAGGDKIFGQGGDDTIYGFGKTPQSRQRDAADKIHGGVGNDTIEGGKGGDEINGGNGIDTAAYITSPNAVTVDLSVGKGTEGDAKGDTLISIENLQGSKNDDTLTGDAQANTIEGRQGKDTINGGNGNDTLKGGFHNDEINGGAGNDKIHGEDGEDVINGGDGIDTIFGGELKDIIDGGKKKDIIYGGGGGDDIKGGGGDDEIYGDTGENTLKGGDGADKIFGGTDRDTIDGGLGQDILAGGDGKQNTFVFSHYSHSGWGAGDKISTFRSGTDKIDLTSLIDSAKDTFDFIGAGMFTKGGDIDIRYDAQNNQIQVDLNNDGAFNAGDLEINSISAVADSDFL